ncbi:MAG TPA: antibiotic biosynthesis monooxygenase family protein [Gammaproteobacteria bacterium]|nr:antibiotic biosynthesis monooxygenase family protein [Gammaproteobacteria bacterium]
MIRVIIERQIAEGLEEFYQTAIANLLEVMTAAPGYLSGELLVEIRRPNHYVVLTRWTNEEAWDRWFHSEQRQELLNAIRPFLLQDEKFTLLRGLSYHRVEGA